MSNFEDLELEDGFEEEDFMEGFHAEAMGSFVKSASKSAAKLTKIIVDNNRINQETMTTADIYQIYVDSFTVAMSTIASQVNEVEEE